MGYVIQEYILEAKLDLTWFHTQGDICWRGIQALIHWLYLYTASDSFQCIFLASVCCKSHFSKLWAFLVEAVFYKLQEPRDDEVR